MKKGTKLVDIATIGAILYLAIHPLSWLITRRWGVFLILTAIASFGWMVPFAYFDEYCCGGGNVGAVWAVAAAFGILTAFGTTFASPPKKQRKRRA
jgi:hypothetical protein